MIVSTNAKKKSWLRPRFSASLFVSLVLLVALAHRTQQLEDADSTTSTTSTTSTSTASPNNQTSHANSSRQLDEAAELSQVARRFGQAFAHAKFLTSCAAFSNRTNETSEPCRALRVETTRLTDRLGAHRTRVEVQMSSNSSLNLVYFFQLENATNASSSDEAAANLTKTVTERQTFHVYKLTADYQSTNSSSSLSGGFDELLKEVENFLPSGCEQLEPRSAVLEVARNEDETRSKAVFSNLTIVCESASSANRRRARRSMENPFQIQKLRKSDETPLRFSKSIYKFKFRSAEPSRANKFVGSLKLVNSRRPLALNSFSVSLKELDIAYAKAEGRSRASEQETGADYDDDYDDMVGNAADATTLKSKERDQELFYVDKKNLIVRTKQSLSSLANKRRYYLRAHFSLNQPGNAASRGLSQSFSAVVIVDVDSAGSSSRMGESAGHRAPISFAKQLYEAQLIENNAPNSLLVKIKVTDDRDDQDCLNSYDDHYSMNDDEEDANDGSGGDDFGGDMIDPSDLEVDLLGADVDSGLSQRIKQRQRQMQLREKRLRQRLVQRCLIKYELAEIRSLGDDLHDPMARSQQLNSDLVFQVKSDSGDIYVKKRLSYDEKSLYYLRLTATKYNPLVAKSQENATTASTESASTLIVVKVLRENLQMKPVFEFSEYNASVLENADFTQRPTVIQVRARLLNATNGEAPRSIVYSLYGSLNDMNTFEVDALSGQVRLVSKLDYRLKKAYKMTLVASDQSTPPNYNYATLNVLIESVDDLKPPRFKQPFYQFIMYEYEQVGYLIGRVSAAPASGGSAATSYGPEDYDQAGSDASGLAAEDDYELSSSGIDGGEDYYLNAAVAIDDVNRLALEPPERSPGLKRRPSITYSIDYTSYYAALKQQSKFDPAASSVELDDLYLLNSNKHASSSLLPFVVDKRNGSIYLNRRLQFKARSEYEFYVIATKYNPNAFADNKLLNSSVKVKVKILDSNELIPVFQQKVYYLNISENEFVNKIGLPLLTLNVRLGGGRYRNGGDSEPRSDLPNWLDYAIESTADSKFNGGDDLFRLIKQTNTRVYLTTNVNLFNIKMSRKTPTKMPRLKRNFNLFVKVKDQNGLYSTTNVRINLVKGGGRLAPGQGLDPAFDEPFKFQRKTFSFNVYENATSGTLIGRIAMSNGRSINSNPYSENYFFNNGSSAASAAKIKFRLIVNEENLALTTVGSAEVTPASSYSSPSPTQMASMMNNLNDYLLKKNQDGQIIYLNRNAAAANSAPTFKSLKSQQAAQTGSQIDFRLDEETGNLYVLNRLDRERYDSISLYVVALSPNVRTTGAADLDMSIIDNAIIRINILDVNDSPPTFNRNTYRLNLYRNFHLGLGENSSYLIRLSAQDKDSGLNGLVGYSFLRGGTDSQQDFNDLFQIDNSNGVVSFNRTRAKQLHASGQLLPEQIELKVIAFDFGEPMLNSTCVLKIYNYMNMDELAPYFDRREYNFDLFVNSDYAESAADSLEDMGDFDATGSAAVELGVVRARDLNYYNYLTGSFVSASDFNGPSSAEQADSASGMVYKIVDAGSAGFDLFELRMNGELNQAALVAKTYNKASRLRESTYRLKIRAYLYSSVSVASASTYLFKDVDVNVFVRNNSLPKAAAATSGNSTENIPSFKIIFNNYKNSFQVEHAAELPIHTLFEMNEWRWSGQSGAISRARLDSLLGNKLVQFQLEDEIGRQLVHVDKWTGRITLKSLLNTNNHINVSFLVAAYDLSTPASLANKLVARCELSVAMISDNLIKNSVTLSLFGMDLGSFFQGGYYEKLVDLVVKIANKTFKYSAKTTTSAVFARANVHVYNLVDHSEQSLIAADSVFLNVSLAVSFNYRQDKFMPSQLLKQIVYANQQELEQSLSVGKVIVYEDESPCLIEPCLNFQKCLSTLKFAYSANSYLKDARGLYQFRSIRQISEFSCKCPVGFTSLTNSFMCDLEISLCFSNPCGNNGVCVSLESSFVCICDPGFAGPTCELNLNAAKCCGSGETAARSILLAGNATVSNGGVNETGQCVSNKAFSISDLFGASADEAGQSHAKVCKGGSVCKNLILGGITCAPEEKPDSDKCGLAAQLKRLKMDAQGNAEQIDYLSGLARDYLFTRFCELRTRHFPKDKQAYLVLPAVQDSSSSETRRFRFKLKLSFATVKADSIILFNGRLNNEFNLNADSTSGSLNDFFMVSVRDSHVLFSYSFGGSLNEVYMDELAVSDGKWRSLTVLFVNNMNLTLSLDNDAFKDVDACDLARNQGQASSRDCYRVNRVGELPKKCSTNQMEQCYRYFDLNGPILVGRGPFEAFFYRQLNRMRKTTTSRWLDAQLGSYEGCISDVFLNEKLVDLQDSLVDRHTELGCLPKLNRCSAAGTVKQVKRNLKQQCARCKHVWLDKVRCDCKENDFVQESLCTRKLPSRVESSSSTIYQFNANRQETKTIDDVFSMNGNGYLQFKVSSSASLSQLNLEYYFKFSGVNADASNDRQELVYVEMQNDKLALNDFKQLRFTLNYYPSSRRLSLGYFSGNDLDSPVSVSNTSVDLVHVESGSLAETESFWNKLSFRVEPSLKSLESQPRDYQLKFRLNDLYEVEYSLVNLIAASSSGIRNNFNTVKLFIGGSSSYFNGQVVTSVGNYIREKQKGFVGCVKEIKFTDAGDKRVSDSTAAVIELVELKNINKNCTTRPSEQRPRLYGGANPCNAGPTSPCFNNGRCAAVSSNSTSFDDIASDAPAAEYDLLSASESVSIRCECSRQYKGQYCQYTRNADGSSYAFLSSPFSNASNTALFIKSISSASSESFGAPKQQQQQCPAKWWGNGVACGPCQCDESKNYSPDCDRLNGKCECKPNYFKQIVDKATREERCVPCDCFLEGSTSLQCEQYTGQCKCLVGAGITGRKCDQCVSPFAEMIHVSSSSSNNGFLFRENTAAAVLNESAAASSTSNNPVECRQLSTSECPKSYIFNIDWPRTQFNRRANTTCPKGAIGHAYRTCTESNSWLNDIDLSECRSLNVIIKQQEHAKIWTKWLAQWAQDSAAVRRSKNARISLFTNESSAKSGGRLYQYEALKLAEDLNELTKQADLSDDDAYSYLTLNNGPSAELSSGGQAKSNNIEIKNTLLQTTSNSLYAYDLMLVKNLSMAILDYEIERSNPLMLYMQDKYYLSNLFASVARILNRKYELKLKQFHSPNPMLVDSNSLSSQRELNGMNRNYFMDLIVKLDDYLRALLTMDMNKSAKMARRINQTSQIDLLNSLLSLPASAQSSSSSLSSFLNEFKLEINLDDFYLLMLPSLNEEQTEDKGLAEVELFRQAKSNLIKFRLVESSSSETAIKSARASKARSFAALNSRASLVAINKETKRQIKRKLSFSILNNASPSHLPSSFQVFTGASTSGNTRRSTAKATTTLYGYKLASNLLTLNLIEQEQADNSTEPAAARRQRSSLSPATSYHVVVEFLLNNDDSEEANDFGADSPDEKSGRSSTLNGRKMLSSANKRLKRRTRNYNCVYLNRKLVSWSNLGARMLSFDAAANTIKCSYDLTALSGVNNDDYSSQLNVIGGIFGIVTQNDNYFLLNKLLSKKLSIGGTLDHSDPSKLGKDAGDEVASQLFGSFEKPINFSLAVYILMPISLTFLLATMLMLSCLRKFGTSLTNIYINLCLNVFIVQLIFLIGVNNNQSNMLCKLTAILEHYFHLTSYTWLLLVCVHLYRMLTELRDINKAGSRTPIFYYLIAYVLPSIVVSLSLGIKQDLYTNYNNILNLLLLFDSSSSPLSSSTSLGGPEVSSSYYSDLSLLQETSLYCWLNMSYAANELIYVYVLPMAIVLVAFVVIMIICLQELKKENSFKQTDIKVVKFNMLVLTVLVPLQLSISAFSFMSVFSAVDDREYNDDNMNQLGGGGVSGEDGIFFNSTAEHSFSGGHASFENNTDKFDLYQYLLLSFSFLYSLACALLLIVFNRFNKTNLIKSFKFIVNSSSTSGKDMSSFSPTSLTSPVNHAGLKKQPTELDDKEQPNNSLFTKFHHLKSININLFAQIKQNGMAAVPHVPTGSTNSPTKFSPVTLSSDICVGADTGIGSATSTSSPQSSSSSSSSSTSLDKNGVKVSSGKCSDSVDGLISIKKAASRKSATASTAKNIFKSFFGLRGKQSTTDTGASDASNLAKSSSNESNECQVKSAYSNCNQYENQNMIKTASESADMVDIEGFKQKHLMERMKLQQQQQQLARKFVYFNEIETNEAPSFNDEGDISLPASTICGAIGHAANNPAIAAQSSSSSSASNMITAKYVLDYHDFKLKSDAVPPLEENDEVSSSVAQRREMNPARMSSRFHDVNVTNQLMQVQHGLANNMFNTTDTNTNDSSSCFEAIAYDFSRRPSIPQPGMISSQRQPPQAHYLNPLPQSHLHQQQQQQQIRDCDIVDVSKVLKTRNLAGNNCFVVSSSSNAQVNQDANNFTSSNEDELDCPDNDERYLAPVKYSVNPAFNKFHQMTQQLAKVNENCSSSDIITSSASSSSVNFQQQQLLPTHPSKAGMPMFWPNKIAECDTSYLEGSSSNLLPPKPLFSSGGAAAVANAAYSSQNAGFVINATDHSLMQAEGIDSDVNEEINIDEIRSSKILSRTPSTPAQAQQSQYLKYNLINSKISTCQTINSGAPATQHPNNVMGSFGGANKAPPAMQNVNSGLKPETSDKDPNTETRV